MAVLSGFVFVSKSRNHFRMALSALRRDGHLTLGLQTGIYLEVLSFCEKNGSTEDWLHQPDLSPWWRGNTGYFGLSVSLLCGIEVLQGRSQSYLQSFSFPWRW